MIFKGQTIQNDTIWVRKNKFFARISQFKSSVQASSSIATVRPNYQVIICFYFCSNRKKPFFRRTNVVRKCRIAQINVFVCGVEKFHPIRKFAVRSSNRSHIICHKFIDNHIANFYYIKSFCCKRIKNVFRLSRRKHTSISIFSIYIILKIRFLHYKRGSPFAVVCCAVVVQTIVIQSNSFENIKVFVAIIQHC